MFITDSFGKKENAGHCLTHMANGMVRAKVRFWGLEQGLGDGRIR
jgi:hypothetical protein